MWDKADFQEWSDHGWDIASLEVAQSSPFGYHQSVHGNPHVSIAKERERERESELVGLVLYLSRIRFLLTSPSGSSCNDFWTVKATAREKKFCHSCSQEREKSGGRACEVTPQR